MRARDERGFTLTELLVAITILSVALLGLAQLQVTGIHSNAKARSLVEANTIAQGLYEEIERLPGDDPLFATGQSDQPWPYAIPGGGAFSVTFTATPDHNGVENLTQLVVSVESLADTPMTGGAGKQRVRFVALKRAF